MSGDVPTPRQSHAVDSDRDIMILFGWDDASGMRNDMIIYNSLNSNWKKLIPKSSIVPRNTNGACIVLYFPLVYIHGGTTDSELTGDFWQFDIGSLEYTKLSIYSPKSYSKCYILDNLFYSLEGNDANDLGFNGYSAYNIVLKSWKYYYYDYYSFVMDFKLC